MLKMNNEICGLTMYQCLNCLTFVGMETAAHNKILWGYILCSRCCTKEIVQKIEDAND